jgi:hypothetical protein
MSEQLEFGTLEDICRNNHGGNPQSEKANAIAAAHSKAKDRLRIIEHLASAGMRGDTCDNMEVSLELRHQTCSARCSELLKDRVVVRKPIPGKPGKYCTRPTRTGANAAVLILARVISFS